MAMLIKIRVTAVIVILVMTGCCNHKGNFELESDELAAFKVEFTKETVTGTPEKRLELSDSYQFSINIYALNHNEETIPHYNGFFELSPQYGKIVSPIRGEVKNGKTENFLVEMRYLLEKEKIAVHELVVDNDKTTKSSIVYRKSGKLGVSKTIYPPIATIYEIQSNNSGTKGFNSKYHNRNLTLKGKKMVVTAVVEGGFFLTDIEEHLYNSIYLYTYSTPYIDDPDTGYSLPVGSLIEEVNGSVFEFFGFTEMSFPTFKPKYAFIDGKNKIVVDSSLIPKPLDITKILSLDEEMEKRESSIVTVKNVTVEWFNEHDSSFSEYGQFPLKTESDSLILAQTLFSAPFFNPIKERDRKSKQKFNITGILKQHTSARPTTWIVVPRGSYDIEIIE
ncbi:MAG: hypothetical protein ACOX2F_07020 [bacterium]